MASSLWELLAQGVTDALNAQTFSLPVEAERGWRLPKQRTEFAADPIATVVPGARSSTLQTRGGTRQHTIQIQVLVGCDHGGISGEVDPVDREDPIAGLAQEVEDYLALPANAITFTDTDEATTLTAQPTGQVSAEVVEELLSDGIFAVLMTFEYSFVR